MSTQTIVTRKGFTIVELLIVVVVIAILAAITVVAYSGIQTRATKTSMLQAANETVKLLTNYHTINGKYPDFTDGVCLGGWGSDGLCQATSNVSWARDATFEAQLKSVGTLPSFPIAGTGGTYTGIMLTKEIGRTMNGSLAEYTVKFFLKGQNNTCDIPNSVRWTSSVYVFDVRDSTWSTTTQCKIVLPQPTA